MTVKTYYAKVPQVQAVRWIPGATNPDMDELCRLAGSEFDGYAKGDNADDPDAQGSYRSVEHGNWKVLYAGGWLVFRGGRLSQMDDDQFNKSYEERV